MHGTTIETVTAVLGTGEPKAGCAADRRQALHIKRWVALYGLCQGRAYE